VSEEKLRQEIVRFCHLTYEKSLLASTDGNLSVRLPDGSILCTATMTNKGLIRPEDLVVIDASGRKIRGERKPSSEMAMHLLIYEMRPDIQAVVHAHPPCATAYAAAGIPLNKALISEVVLALGCIPLAEYGTPGTPELSDEIRPFIKHYDALLMANHGVVTYGANIEEAFNRMDTGSTLRRFPFTRKSSAGSGCCRLRMSKSCGFSGRGITGWRVRTRSQRTRCVL